MFIIKQYILAFHTCTEMEFAYYVRVYKSNHLHLSLVNLIFLRKETVPYKADPHSESSNQSLPEGPREAHFWGCRNQAPEVLPVPLVFQDFRGTILKCFLSWSNTRRYKQLSGTHFLSKLKAVENILSWQIVHRCQTVPQSSSFVSCGGSDIVGHTASNEIQVTRCDWKVHLRLAHTGVAPF